MPSKPSPIFKYHGTGNDFVIVDAADWPVDFVALAGALCDRHRGVGADGVIVVDRAANVPAGFDARMTIYNRDGSRPEMCGNGIRCVARHLVQVHGFDEELKVATDAGPRHCVVHRRGDAWEVDVDMGAARPEEPVELEWGGGGWTLHPVDMGNPHAVVFRTVSESTADGIGEQLNAADSPFGDGVNVEFVTRRSPDEIDVLVYERGVGRTQACGTGACAAAFAAWDAGEVEKGEVTVTLPGGPLRIREIDGHIWMRGDVEFVFEGNIRDEWMTSRTQ